MRLVVDVDGYEGPLDLLLKLARDQKVDLAKISILALAEQYLAFVERARLLRLEIAADYLVMAAWLAYLKSRLLLPEEKTEATESGDELAAGLALRLRRLEAMREAGRRLLGRAQLGIHVQRRGMPEVLAIRTRSVWDAKLYDSSPPMPPSVCIAWRRVSMCRSGTSFRCRRRASGCCGFWAGAQIGRRWTLI